MPSTHDCVQPAATSAGAENLVLLAAFELHDRRVLPPLGWRREKDDGQNTRTDHAYRNRGVRSPGARKGVTPLLSGPTSTIRYELRATPTPSESQWKDPYLPPDRGAKTKKKEHGCARERTCGKSDPGHLTSPHSSAEKKKKKRLPLRLEVEAAHPRRKTTPTQVRFFMCLCPKTLRMTNNGT